MMSKRTIVALLGLAILAAGCGGGAGGQDTPKAAMKKFQASILENDKDDFLEVVAYPEEHEEVVGPCSTPSPAPLACSRRWPLSMARTPSHNSTRPDREI